MRGPLLVTTLLLAACEPAAAAPTADAGLAQRMDAMEDRLARIEATLTSAHKDITSMKESVDDLHRKIDDAPAAPPAPSAVPPRRTPRPPLEEIEHITCDEDACHVDRSYLETLFEKPAELARQARVVPAVEDGETIGFKLYGIRSGSLPHALGFSN